MGLVPEEHKQHLKEEFEAKLRDEVHLVMFTKEPSIKECDFSKVKTSKKQAHDMKC